MTAGRRDEEKKTNDSTRMEPFRKRKKGVDTLFADLERTTTFHLDCCSRLSPSFP
jgi:hypothetical protein